MILRDNIDDDRLIKSDCSREKLHFFYFIPKTSDQAISNTPSDQNKPDLIENDHLSDDEGSIPKKVDPLSTHIDSGSDSDFSDDIYYIKPLPKKHFSVIDFNRVKLDEMGNPDIEISRSFSTSDVNRTQIDDDLFEPIEIPESTLTKASMETPIKLPSQNVSSQTESYRKKAKIIVSLLFLIFLFIFWKHLSI